MADFSLSIEGKDITDLLVPIVLSISIRDVSGAHADTADVVLFDDQTIKLPGKGVEIEIGLVGDNGQGVVFKGVVDAVRSRGGRGGRQLSITAKGADVTGDAKVLRSRHWDGASLGTIVDQAARDAGLDGARVDPAFASQAPGYVAQHGESFMAFGQRLAREVGGTFKINGRKAYLVQRGGGVNTRGQALATIIAEYGVNLKDWDIAPDAGRDSYGSASVRTYDPDTGGWTVHTAQSKAKKKGKAKHHARYPAGSAASAANRANSDAGEAFRNGGSGSCGITLDVRAKPEGQCQIKGARPGIDGTYRITAVTHAYDRGSGTSTGLELGEPTDGAGEDDR